MLRAIIKTSSIIRVFHEILQNWNIFRITKQKTEEDIQAAKDKCNYLSRVKGKLEQALDEAEDSLDT